MSAKLGSLTIACIQLRCKNCSLYGVAGCPLFRGYLSIEVNGRTELSVILWLSAVQGCPLSGVPLYFVCSVCVLCSCVHVICVCM